MDAHFTMHTWSKSGILICWRPLVTSKESSNPIFFLRKWPILHHTCSELTCFILVPWLSIVKKKFFTFILFANFRQIWRLCPRQRSRPTLTIRVVVFKYTYILALYWYNDVGIDTFDVMFELMLLMLCLN